MFFHSIVYGSMKSRARDRYGSGQFGAPRDEGRRTHKGVDVIARPGELILAPINGDIVREASPYEPFTGLLIKGSGPHANYTIKLFYVTGMFCGPVRAGDVIGSAEDLSRVYPGITNHVHIEVRLGGRILPPFDLYQMCF